MANSPVKSPSKRKSQSIIAYVHDLSPEKKNKSGTLKYKSLTLQTSATECREALLYSTEKSCFLEESLESRTPLKMQNIAHTADGKKIVINDMTYITSPKTSEYNFQYDADLPQHVETTPVPIIDALNKYNEWDTFTVTGKITRKKSTTIVGSTKLRLCEAFIADNTATMPFDIWEDKIEQFKQGSIYKVAPVQVRVWSGIKKLSTVVKSTVTEVADELLADIPLVTSDVNDEDADLATATVKEILRVNSSEKFLRCQKCNRKVQGDCSSKIVGCQRCGSMRADRCKYGLSVKAEVKLSDDEELCIKFGDEVLTKILNDDVLSMDEESIIEKLLFIEDTRITYNVSTRIVQEIPFESTV